MTEDAAGLLEAWRLHPGDEAVRERCLLAHIYLVKRVWASLKTGLPPSADAIADDLMQCGSVGLLQAMDTWRPDKGAPFEAWARLRIRGAMLDELRRQDVLSKECRRRWKALRHALEALEQRLERPCTEEEWATELGIGIEVLREQILENSPGTVVFLDCIGPDGGLSLHERLSDVSAPEADTAALAQEVRLALTRAIGQLPEQERRLLFLLLEQELGHKEAAEVLGVSPGRVSQIYAKAILHLQAALAIKFSD